MASAKARAGELWASVLESMPPDLHSRYALVQARQRMIGMENADEVAAEIDRLARQSFGGDHLLAREFPPKTQALQETPMTEDDIRQAVLLAVHRGFNGTADGSPESDKFLEEQALANAKQVIEAHKKHLGWLARRRLWKAAKALATTRTLP